MKIFSEEFKNLFRKQKVAILKTGEAFIPVQFEEVKPNDDLFTCHYCQHQFEFQSKDIFPTSVRLLYKDQFVTGKGIKCPKCLKDSIFG